MSKETCNMSKETNNTSQETYEMSKETDEKTCVECRGPQCRAAVAKKVRRTNSAGSGPYWRLRRRASFISLVSIYLLLTERSGELSPVCVYECTYICVYVNMCVCVYGRVCVRVCVSVCVCVRLCVF